MSTQSTMSSRSEVASRPVRSRLAMLAFALVLAFGSNAFAGWEYLRDVYGNGNWDWTEHNYPSRNRAIQEARQACQVGTNVREIGFRLPDGRIINREPFRCR